MWSLHVFIVLLASFVYCNAVLHSNAPAVSTSKQAHERSQDAPRKKVEKKTIHIDQFGTSISDTVPGEEKVVALAPAKEFVEPQGVIEVSDVRYEQKVRTSRQRAQLSIKRQRWIDNLVNKAKEGLGNFKIPGTEFNFGSLLNAFLVFKKTFDNLKVFTDCLNKVPKNDLHLRNMLEFMSGFGGKFGEFGKAFKGKYVDANVESVKKFVNKKAPPGVGKLKGVLHGVEIIKVEMLKSATWLNKMMDEVWDEVQKMAAEPGFETYHCVVQYIIRPSYSNFKPPIISVIIMVVGTLQKQWDKLVAKATDHITSKVKPYIEKNSQLQAMVKTAAQAVSDDCMKQMEMVSTEIVKYNDMVNGGEGEDAVALQETFDQIWKGLGTSANALLKVASNALVATLELFFRQIQEKYVGPALQKAVDTLSTILNWGLKLINGVCGIIPEIGSSVCSIVSSGVQSAATYVSTTLEQAGQDSLSGVFKMIMSTTSAFVDKVITGVENNKLVQGALALFKPFVDEVQKFAKFIVPEVEAKLKECTVMKSNMRDILEKKYPVAAAQAKASEDPGEANLAASFIGVANFTSH